VWSRAGSAGCERTCARLGDNRSCLGDTVWTTCAGPPRDIAPPRSDLGHRRPPTVDSRNLSDFTEPSQPVDGIWATTCPLLSSARTLVMSAE